VKTTFVFVLTCCCLLARAQRTDLSTKLLQLVESEKQASASRVNPAKFTSINDYDVKFHRCEWQVDPAVNYIRGKITTYFKPLTANFDSIKFNLTDLLTVDSIKYHGSLLLFSHSGNIVRAGLPALIPVNMLDSVSVYYQGQPSGGSSGSFVQSTHSATNNTPVIWTFSEPYGASDWWPCKNSLTDKADSIDVIVTSPSAYRTASNGLLASEIISGANRTCYWKHRYPIATYLVCFATTNYVKYVNYVPFQSTNLMEQSFVYPEDSASIASQTPADIPIMQLYDTLFGIYPFIKEKYGHVETGKTMEHQTMSFFGTNSFGFETLAHELAHQWFGNYITCASWRDIWLNEGFATYLSGLAYERMLGGVWWMPFKSSRITEITSKPNGSVWCDDTTSADRIFDSRLSYAKGAMLLHQLRWVIGDSAFFAGIRNYLNDPALAFGFARTSDIKHHFEVSCGQDLTWYFNDWFTGQGFPSYHISWSQSGSAVTLTVHQTQSDPSVPFFELPLPVQLKGPAQDTIVRIDNTSQNQTFSLNIPFTVNSVKLDPDLWIIQAAGSSAHVDENDPFKYISVFPNPVRGKLQIMLSKDFEDLAIKLLDLTGRVVKTTAVKGERNSMIDCEGISPGLYFLQFNSGTYTVARKIVVGN